MYLLELLTNFTVKLSGMSAKTALATLRLLLSRDPVEPAIKAALQTVARGRIELDKDPELPVATFALERNDEFEAALETLCRYCVEAFALAQQQQLELMDVLTSGNVDDRLELAAYILAYWHHEVVKDTSDIFVQAFANQHAPHPPVDPNVFRRAELVAMLRMIANYRKADVKLDIDAIKTACSELLAQVSSPFSVPDFRAWIEEALDRGVVQLPMFVPNWLLVPHLAVPTPHPHAAHMLHSNLPGTHTLTASAPLQAALALHPAAVAPLAAPAPSAPAAAPAPSMAAGARSAAAPFTWYAPEATVTQALTAAAEGRDLYSIDLLRQPLLLLRSSAQPMPDVLRLLRHGAAHLHDTLFTPSASLCSAPSSSAAFAPAAPAHAAHQPAMPALAATLNNNAVATADALIEYMACYILSSGPYSPEQDAKFRDAAVEAAELQESGKLPVTYDVVVKLFNIVRVRKPTLDLLHGVELFLGPSWPAPDRTPTAGDGQPEPKRARATSIEDVVADQAAKVERGELADVHRQLKGLGALGVALARAMVAIQAVMQGRMVNNASEHLIDTRQTPLATPEQNEAADTLFEMAQGNMGSHIVKGTPFTPPSATAPAQPSRAATHFVKPSNEPTLDSHTDVNDFFVKYELYSDIARIPAAERINRALLCIKSAAVVNQWLAYARDLPDRTPTWLEFKEQIRLYTNGHCTADKALDSLALCTQGGQPMDKYISRYTRLVAQAALDSKSPFVIRGFVRGIADDSIRTILHDGPGNGQPWESLSAVTARAAKLATAKFNGKHSSNHSPRTPSFLKKRNKHDSGRPFHKPKWGSKPNKFPRRHADNITNVANQAIATAIQNGTLAAPQPAPLPAMHPYHMAAPAMHVAPYGGHYGGGRGRGRGGRHRGTRGSGRGNQQEEQQQEENAAEAPARAARTFSVNQFRRG